MSKQVGPETGETEEQAEIRRAVDGVDGDPLLDTLNGMGLNRDYWIKRLKQELNAGDMVTDRDTGRKRKIPNWKIRQEARRDLVQYRGEKAPDKVLMGTIEQAVKAMTDDQLDREIERLNAQRTPLRPAQGTK